MRLAIILLQFLLGLAFLGALVMQVWGLPAVSRQVAAEYPGVADLRIPCLIGAIGFVACVQVMLLACSALLILAARGQLRRRSAAHLIEVVIGATLVAGLLCFAVALWILIDAGGWSPPVAGLDLLGLLCIVAAVLVGVARRRLGVTRAEGGSAGRQEVEGSRSAGGRA